MLFVVMIGLQQHKWSDDLSLTFTAVYVCLCSVFSRVIILGMSVRFS